MRWVMIGLGILALSLAASMLIGRAMRVQHEEPNRPFGGQAIGKNPIQDDTACGQAGVRCPTSPTTVPTTQSTQTQVVNPIGDCTPR